MESYSDSIGGTATSGAVSDCSCGNSIRRVGMTGSNGADDPISAGYERNLCKGKVTADEIGVCAVFMGLLPPALASDDVRGGSDRLPGANSVPNYSTGCQELYAVGVLFVQTGLIYDKFKGRARSQDDVQPS